ncbi:MAG: Na+:solute symporter [Pirellulales bacterium]|nr:Na+:solute symporter [Pirellulales bacterium]
MTTIDYAIVIAYMLFALSVGLYFSKKASKNSESFFLGGRSLPWWAIGVSMVATSFASDTPLVTTEMVRMHGIQKLWWVLVSVMPLIIGIFLFSRLWRRANIITDAQVYELRYEGNSAAVLRGFKAFFHGVVQNLLTMAWVIFGMGRVISIMTGIEDQVLTTGICIAVALTYATFSGFYGVVITDLVQFSIATFSMIALAVIAVVNLGGLDTILTRVAELPEYGKDTLSIFPDLTTLNDNTKRLIVFVTLFWWSDAGGYNMQRMSACRNERDSVLATLFYAVFQTIRPWMWVVVALASIVMFPTISEQASDSPVHDEITEVELQPEGSRSLKKHTDGYPMVMREFLGMGMRGLLVTAFLAAFMSTIDTQLNWGASYLMTDIYQRFIKKEATDKHYMLVTKFVVVGLMLVGAAIVPLVPSVTAAWEFLTLLMIGSGFFTVLRWFWWRVNAYTELTALVLGIVVGVASLIAMWIAETPRDYISESLYMSSVAWNDMLFEIRLAILTGIVIPVSLLVTFLTPPVSKEKLEEFYRKVRPGGFWSVLDTDVRTLPGKVLSLTSLTYILGGMMLCYGLSLAIGYAILLNFQVSGFCLVMAGAGGVIVKRWFNREVEMMSVVG